MLKKKKDSEMELPIQFEKKIAKPQKSLNGLEHEDSLLSVNFAPAENTYLNEYVGEEP